MLLTMSIEYSIPISVIVRGINKLEELSDGFLSKVNDE